MQQYFYLISSRFDSVIMKCEGSYACVRLFMRNSSQDKIQEMVKIRDSLNSFGASVPEFGAEATVVELAGLVIDHFDVLWVS